MPTDTLAIDFGTSNSAAAVAAEDRVRRLPIEQGAETLPTAVFFPADSGAMQIGAAATESPILRDQGRYLRAPGNTVDWPHATTPVCQHPDC